MNIATDIIPREHDHYEIHINGVDLGKWERSQLRQLIQDNDI